MDALEAAFRKIALERGAQQQKPSAPEAPPDSPAEAGDGFDQYRKPVSDADFSSWVKLFNMDTTLGFRDQDERFKAAFPLYEKAVEKGVPHRSAGFARIIYSLDNPPGGRMYWLERAYQHSMDAALETRDGRDQYQHINYGWAGMAAEIAMNEADSLEEKRTWAERGFSAQNLAFQRAEAVGDRKAVREHSIQAAKMAEWLLEYTEHPEEKPYLLKRVVEWHGRAGQLSESEGRQNGAMTSYSYAITAVSVHVKDVPKQYLMDPSPLRDGKTFGEYAYDLSQKAVALGRKAGDSQHVFFNLARAAEIAEMMCELAPMGQEPEWAERAFTDRFESGKASAGFNDEHAFVQLKKAGEFAAKKLDAGADDRRLWLMRRKDSNIKLAEVAERRKDNVTLFNCHRIASEASAELGTMASEPQKSAYLRESYEHGTGCAAVYKAVVGAAPGKAREEPYKSVHFTEYKIGKAAAELSTLTRSAESRQWTDRAVEAFAASAEHALAQGDIPFAGQRFKDAAQQALKSADESDGKVKADMLVKAAGLMENAATTAEKDHPAIARKTYYRAAEIALRLSKITSGDEGPGWQQESDRLTRKGRSLHDGRR